MGDKSKIEWTDATWNPVVGCSVVSPGCTNCYAMRQADRIRRMNGDRSHYFATTKIVNGKPVWTGEVRQAPDSVLLAPLRWGRPRAIFVNSMGDLFHESVADAWIDRVFAVMALAPRHMFICLTKRAKRMREYFAGCEYVPGRDGDLKWDGCSLVTSWHRYEGVQRAIFEVYRSMNLKVELGKIKALPLPNVVLGVSAERQQEADERIPNLLATPAAKRVVSIEPMLGAMDVSPWLSGSYECAAECGWRSGSAPPREICHSCGLTSEKFGEFCLGCSAQDFGHICPQCESNAVKDHPDTPCLEGVILGGESGPNARPMHPDWPRAIRDQCAAAQVPFFFKQWGEWGQYRADLVRVGSPIATRAGYRPATMRIDRGLSLLRYGKRGAGRLLDGREHDDLPWKISE